MCFDWLIFRSTPPSRPNKAGLDVCPCVHKKFSPVVPNRGEISPWGEILVFQGGNTGCAGNINIAVDIALINIHVSLIFLNNSWNHSTDKSKSQFFASYVYVYLSTKYRIILMK